MAVFEVESGGVKYEVEAPDQETAIRALQDLMKDAPQLQAQEEPSGEPYSGAILPFSRDAEGSVSFDPQAGVLGPITRTLDYAGKTMRGEPGGYVPGQRDPNIGQRVLEAGAVVSPVNPAIRAGSRIIPGAAQAPTRKPRVKPPTAEELKRVGGAGIDAYRRAPVRYTADSLTQWADTVGTEITREGFGPQVAKSTHKLLQQLRNPPEGAFVSPDDLIAFRKNLRTVAGNFNKPEDQRAALDVIRRLDDFISRPDPTRVSGPAAAAGARYAEGTADYAAGKRSEYLAGVGESAERRASTTASGSNIDNTLRQRVASILENPKQRAGFNAEEIALLEQVARGTATRNTLRRVGNLLGGGVGIGGFGAAVGGGAAAGATLPGAAVGLGILGTGLGSRAAANQLTKRALRRVDEATRRRSPLYSQRVQQAPATPINPEVRALLLRSLGITALPEPGTPPARPPMTREEYEAYLRGGGT